jgi:tyrosinase
VHGEKMRWPRRFALRKFFLLLAAGLGVFPAWAFGASVVLASASVLTLDGAQHSVTLNVDSAHGAALRQIAQGQRTSLPGDPAGYRSALLVLDDVTLTAAGARGGYFYRIYLAPVGDARASERQLVGTLGPFEIAAARQRGMASLRYALGEVLDGFRRERESALVVSFQRAGGADGALIGIGEMRVELSTEVGN